MERFKNLCSLTSVLDGIGCTVMAHLDFLLLQAWAQQVECHYDYTQVKDANSGCLSLPIFCLKKKNCAANGVATYTLMLKLFFIIYLFFCFYSF